MPEMPVRLAIVSRQEVVARGLTAMLADYPDRVIVTALPSVWTKAAGVEAMQLYSLDQGHGNRPRPDEFERYLRDVLDHVEIPVVLSSHQAAGYWIQPDLINTLVGEG